MSQPFRAMLFAIGTLAVLASALASVPADAQSRKKKKQIAPAAKTEPMVPNLNIAGTYTFTRIMGRRVRDVDLAMSRMTFDERLNVQGQTACNGFSTRIKRGPDTRHLLVFEPPIATEMACGPKQMNAQQTTFDLLGRTANIASTGDVVSLFNENNLVIAQLTKSAHSNGPTNASPKEANPTRAEVQPVARIETGDYTLAELNGAPVALQGTAASAEQPKLAPNTRLLPVIPTLFLRDSNSVSGLAGCNRYTGSLVLGQNGQTRIGPLGVSKRACLDRAVSRLETDLLSAFQRAVRVEITSANIELLGANGARIARFSNAAVAATPDNAFEQQKWTLRLINGGSVSITSRPDMTFDGGRISGFSGCNRFSGGYTRQGNRLQISQIVSTRMACTNPAQSRTETQFLSALRTISQMTQAGQTLILRAQDGGSTLVFDAS